MRPEAGALAAAGVVVALDQATKQLAIERIAPGAQVAVVPGLDLTNARNTGVAFGALEGGGLVVAILIGLSLGLLLVYFLFQRDTPWLWLPVGAVVGGALGNLADRARDGAVIDFIDPVSWPAFNLADSAIVIGVAGLIFLTERGARRGRSS